MYIATVSLLLFVWGRKSFMDEQGTLKSLKSFYSSLTSVEHLLRCSCGLKSSCVGDLSSGLKYVKLLIKTAEELESLVDFTYY